MDHFYKSVEGYFTFPDFYEWVSQHVPDKPHCVEVGVYAGQSAAFLGVELANRRPAARLDLVDAFGQVSRDKVLANLAPLKAAGILGDVHERLSWDGAKLYADKSLDFVFIDADHAYEAVAQDIDAWLPKVKPFGILAGHDFCNEFPGVIRAVTERFEQWRVFRGINYGGNAPMYGKYYPVWMVRPQ